MEATGGLSCGTCTERTILPPLRRRASPGTMAASKEDQVVHYGDRVQLLATSRYAAAGNVKVLVGAQEDRRGLEPIGTYKNSRHVRGRCCCTVAF